MVDRDTTPIIEVLMDPRDAGFTEEEIAYGAAVPAQSVVKKLLATGRKANHQHSRVTGGVRDKLTNATMKADIAAFWRNRDTYKEIAEKISDRYGLVGPARITEDAIHWHIKRMLEYWRDKAMARIDERQAVILARFDQLESICTEAYFRSVEGKTTNHHNKQLTRARSKDREKQLLDKELEKRAKEEKNPENDARRVKPVYAETFAEAGEIGDLLAITEEKINETTRTETALAGDVKWITLMFQINKERAKILGLYNVQNQLDPDQEAAKLSGEERALRINALLQTARDRRQAQTNMLADPAPMGGFKEGDEPVQEITNVPDIEVPLSETNGWGFDEDTIADEEYDEAWD